MIKNMIPSVTIGLPGSAALLVVGLRPSAALFLPAMIAVGTMGTIGALARGRMDRVHRVPHELQTDRRMRFQSASRTAQLVLPIAIAQGISVVGVQVTMLGLTITGTALTAGLWLAMRGDGRDPVLKPPPTVLASTVGAFRQVVGTPWGLVRRWRRPTS